MAYGDTIASHDCPELINKCREQTGSKVRLSIR